MCRLHTGCVAPISISFGFGLWQRAVALVAVALAFLATSDDGYVARSPRDTPLHGSVSHGTGMEDSA